MLIYSKTRYTPVSVNMITLENEHGYFHVHRALYDKAVILHDQYDRARPSLRTLIAGAKQRPEAEYFYENVPAPLGILGYFLDLVVGEDSLGEDLELLCGAIHVMSMSLDFRQLLRVDSKIRTSIRFSLTIREEYKVQWDRFFAESSPYEEMRYVRAQNYYEPGEHQPFVKQGEYLEPAETEQQEEDPLDFLYTGVDLDAIREEIAAEREQETNTTASAPAVGAPVAASADSTYTEPKAPSGLDILKGW